MWLVCHVALSRNAHTWVFAKPGRLGFVALWWADEMGGIGPPLPEKNSALQSYTGLFFIQSGLPLWPKAWVSPMPA
ncbi:hypothetical protein SKAU_G00208060 [Synaphobranchus kaupii]|uniref:Uncharacterized protein n=1 Tax=Synaphobranchus kaupii TaxID=118154 RepID=A0A9Q1IUA4_SYNKA|nr:hypothetical protein SKAU_G00208060 [Synaphobranchus kaupii]